MEDFFVSYTTADQPWAEWIAWQLENEGYKTVIQAWDFHAGSNFVSDMQEAATSTECTIAVLSPAFLKSPYTKAEWTAAFAKDPTGAERKLIVVRVKKVEPPGLLNQIGYIDLVDLKEDQASEKLLKQIKGERAKPDKPPGFPGTDERFDSTLPNFPGALPQKTRWSSIVHVLIGLCIIDKLKKYWVYFLIAAVIIILIPITLKNWDHIVYAYRWIYSWFTGEVQLH